MKAVLQQASTLRPRPGAAALIAALLGGGCNLKDAPILYPKGPIALAERDLVFDAIAVMLIVVVPVIVLALLFAWQYRASNANARYRPDWSSSSRVEAVVWLIPALIVIALSVLLWRATHRLDPYKRIDSALRPIEVQAIAQDWKWLFIYPEQKVAAVNQLVFPSGTPLSLKITSDTVMNSFFIPALGGQIYAMAGMQAQLHLLADAPGSFTGRNTQYSGDGFANQHFEAIATTLGDFEAWVARVKQSPQQLDAASYHALAAPSIGHSVTYYSAVQPGLFEAILAKYRGGAAHAGHQAAK